MTIQDDAAAIAGDLAELRRRIHQDPEIGLEPGLPVPKIEFAEVETAEKEKKKIKKGVLTAIKPTTLAWRPTASFGLAELDASLP